MASSSSSSKSDKEKEKLATTCLPCKNVKKRCNGAQPRCGRCERLNLTCETQIYVPRRRHTDLLEQKALALELKLASLTKDHDHVLLSKALSEKIRVLDHFPLNGHYARNIMVLPVFPRYATFIGSTFDAAVPVVDVDVGYKPVVPRSALDGLFTTWNPGVDAALSQEQSLSLIRAFLPYRFQNNFLISLPYFFEALTHSPDDPLGAHPCLLNAIYAVSCHIAGGRLSTFVPYFLRKSREHQHKSLEVADRLGHFLWSNVILGSYFMCMNRLNDAYATISSTARFALACGLDGVTPGMEDSASAPQYPLLPPPMNEYEVLDRWQLSHAIYLLDRTLAMTSGLPSAFSSSASLSTEWLIATALISGQLKPNQSPDVVTLKEDLTDGLVDLINTERPPLTQSMLLFERVERLGREIHEHGYNAENHALLKGLGYVITSFKKHLPPVEATHCTLSSENYALSNPHMVIAHATCHGSNLLLYSLAPQDDANARHQVFEAVTALAALFRKIRKVDGLSRIQGFLVPMVHAMNAARICVSYLQQKEILRSSKLLAICYKSLATFLEFLYEVTEWFPAWSHIIPRVRAMFPESVKRIILEE